MINSKKTKTKLPLYLKKYFWDVDFSAVDIQKYPEDILRRILDYGDTRTIAWMWKHYSAEEIRSFLTCHRGLSLRSANFWATILDVPKKDVVCLKKLWSKEPEIFWPY